MQIDQRGGHFTQKSMCSALRLALESESMIELFSAAVLSEGFSSVTEGLQLTSYKLRVMCAHVRQKYDCKPVI